MYLHERLAPRYPATVVPGVTSFSAAAAAAGTPLVRRDDVLTILPGRCRPRSSPRGCAAATPPSSSSSGARSRACRRRCERAGLVDRAIYVERASSAAERIAPLAEAGDKVPYMSLVLVPGGRAHRAPRTDGRAASASSASARPARDWLTPEAHAELAAADELVGYETVPRARAGAPRSGPPRDRQPRGGRARPPRARARGRRRARRGRLLRRPRHLRDGSRGARGRRRRHAPSPTSSCASCRGSRRCRRRRPASARRSATTSA